jgi:hypothetical protein
VKEALVKRAGSVLRLKAGGRERFALVSADIENLVAANCSVRFQPRAPSAEPRAAPPLRPLAAVFSAVRISRWLCRCCTADRGCS